MTDLQSYLLKLPEWNDDQRSLSLFSSFRGSFDDAPESWRAKVYFWKDLILHSLPRKWLGNQDIFCFERHKLFTHFQRNGSFPLSLDLVMDYLIEEKEMYILSEYLQPRTNHSRQKVISQLKSFLMTSFVWTGQKISALFAAEGEKEHPTESKIKIDQKQILAGKVIEQYEKHTHDFVDSCISTEEFKQCVIKCCGLLGWSEPSDKDIFYLLKYIQLHQAQILIHTCDEAISSSSAVIALKMAHHDYARADLLEIIKSVIKLKTTIHHLEGQIKTRDIQMSRYEIDIKEYLFKSKNKVLALETLKRKKLIEESQLKVIKSLHNLEAIVASIRSAKNDEQILQAYQYGTKALNIVLSQKEMSIESVDQMMDSIMESMEKQREIDLAIVSGSESMVAVLGVDEQDLETELELLLEAQRKGISKESVIHRDDAQVNQLVQQINQLHIPTTPPAKEEKILTPAD